MVELKGRGAGAEGEHHNNNNTYLGAAGQHLPQLHNMRVLHHLHDGNLLLNLQEGKKHNQASISVSVRAVCVRRVLGRVCIALPGHPCSAFESFPCPES